MWWTLFRTGQNLVEAWAYYVAYSIDTEEEGRGSIHDVASR